MKLKTIETFTNEFVCFVKATAEDGAVGWGQTSTYNADITATVFHRQIAPWALGQPCGDIAALVEAKLPFPGTTPDAVVRALRDLLPNESIVYLGDTARVPYGSKSPDTQVAHTVVEMKSCIDRIKEQVQNVE